MDSYDIKYDTIQQEFYIFSKNDNRPSIGSFKTAAMAIDFAEQRVVSLDKRS